MRYESIYPLWDRFEKSSLSELEIDIQGMHLKLVRNNNIRSQTLDEKESGPDSEPVSKAEQFDDFQGINAPLTGTFYIAPSPDSDPYVEPGQKVKKGDVIGIIEAMKLMNELKADRDGKVSEILVKDGQLVEYGSPIIRMDYV